VVAERFARRAPLLARPRGGRGGQERVAGCEMADAGVAEARDALGRARESALRRIRRARKQLLVDVALAVLAQRREGGRVAAALGEAVAAVAERVRTGTEAPLGERRIARKLEGLVRVGADVLAYRQRVELALGHWVQDAAGLFGAFGGVFGEVAGDLAPLVHGELAHVELVAPADRAVAELFWQRRPDLLDGRADTTCRTAASATRAKR
jgi:hypothetical protein